MIISTLSAHFDEIALDERNLNWSSETLLSPRLQGPASSQFEEVKYDKFYAASHSLGILILQIIKIVRGRDFRKGKELFILGNRPTRLLFASVSFNCVRLSAGIAVVCACVSVCV